MKSPFGEYNIINNVLLCESSCASWLRVKKILAKQTKTISHKDSKGTKVHKGIKNEIAF